MGAISGKESPPRPQFALHTKEHRQKHADWRSSQPRTHRDKPLTICTRTALDDETKEGQYDVCTGLSARPVVACRLVSGGKMLMFRGKYMPQRSLSEAFSTGAFHDGNGTGEARQADQSSGGKMLKGPSRVDCQTGSAHPHPYLTICQSSGEGRAATHLL